MTKIIKQDQKTADVVAAMVAAAVAGTPAEVAETAAAVEVAAAKSVKATKTKTAKAKKITKPTPAAKKAGKAAAKVAIVKAQKSAAVATSTAIRSAKQGLTFGQWLKLLSNTATKTGVKVPTSEAGLTKKFQPVFMAGKSVREALSA